MTQPATPERPAAIQPVPDRYTPLGAGQVVAQRATGVRLAAGRAVVEVDALAADLFRVGYFPGGGPITYASEAIARESWPPGAEVRSVEGGVDVLAGAATAHVHLAPLRIGFQTADGRSFAEDDPRLGMGTLAPLPAGGLEAVLGPRMRVYKQRPPTERYFGCGERTGGLEKTATHQTFWNIDPPIGHSASHDNLYTSIPFVLALDRGRAWGLFLDNPGRTEFDLGRDDPATAWFGADAGSLVYYVFAGPTPRAVLDRYTELTGRTPMPPLWALGSHQSRWEAESAESLRALAHTFRQRDIPCDALYLDIDYMDGFRVFTWDPERFPDPGGLLEELGREGFHVVTIVDPGVKVEEQYPVYRSGHEAGVFCRTMEGKEYHNVVWPGVCAFPDFTSARARAWWGEQHRPLVEQGVAGIWCDMNEPTAFIPSQSTFPGDVVHPGDGEPRLHAQVHNLYGLLMARATREALLRLRPDRRPLVISRSGYAGLQRYALQWTGDNSSWWEHLWMAMPQVQNMGLSGLAWAGVDVGGFFGDATGELLARWTEFGAFQPFCRNHSARGTRRQEPWSFGERYEAVIRTMLRLRQRLIPYLYTLFEECHRTGAPVLRPLLFEFPADETTYSADDEFLVGEALLVAPITRPGAEYRHVYLPRGSWFHFWSGQRHEGAAHILARGPLGAPPLYVRANVPLPLWPEMRYVGERPADPLDLLVYVADGHGASSLYEDAGDGFEYETGAFARRRIACETTSQRVEVRFGPREGSFVPPRTSARLNVRGFGGAPAAVRLDGKPLDGWFVDEDTVVVPLRETADAQTVEIVR